ncbi:hypothetical protein INN71_07455 [Nocardioides sp. ChNu-153]|uniref:DUF6167 family protein n=1 Tax=unclassified Nocardioides TaxID=2615069 RepID=UPI00240519AA|nr:MULTISPECIES: DUF6167 family protein [unclassified Nocardioides]MDF9717682.1 hypothetical protein [Nocardioides sp. ChNu-99]MDN7121226.1 hypothetical protein [Nocardioides sp. ChNu-153]
MRGGIWFVTGAGAGLWAAVRARRAAEALTPDGARDRLAGLRVGARMLAEEFTAGAAEKDAELRERFGLVPHGLPELTPGARGATVPGSITAPDQAPDGPAGVAGAAPAPHHPLDSTPGPRAGQEGSS